MIKYDFKYLFSCYKLFGKICRGWNTIINTTYYIVEVFLKQQTKNNVCPLLVVIYNLTIHPAAHKLKYNWVKKLWSIKNSCVVIIMFRTRPDRSATEPSLQRTIEEPWASCWCMTSQTRTRSVLSRTGEWHVHCCLYCTCVLSIFIIHCALLSGPPRSRRTRGITHRWF